LASSSARWAAQRARCCSRLSTPAFARWAAAAARHFQGRHIIWEIWNEPENQPAMWTGTDDQYFQLYEVTAKAIKSRWPDLKVALSIPQTKTENFF
jgi:hypothetical protein